TTGHSSSPSSPTTAVPVPTCVATVPRRSSATTSPPGATSTPRTRTPGTDRRWWGAPFARLPSCHDGQHGAHGTGAAAGQPVAGAVGAGHRLLHDPRRRLDRLDRDAGADVVLRGGDRAGAVGDE